MRMHAKHNSRLVATSIISLHLYSLVCEAVTQSLGGPLLNRSKALQLASRFTDASVEGLTVPDTVEDALFATRWTRDVVVRFEFAIHHIISFDLASSTIQLSGYFRLWWNDGGLIYNGTQEIGERWDSELHSVPVEKGIWKPDIHAVNGNDVDDAATYRDSYFKVFDLGYLRAHGYNVLWSRAAWMNFNCDDKESLAEFPFDHHVCTLKFSSWHEQPWNIRFIGYDSGVHVAFFGSQEWSSRVESVVNVSNVTYAGGPFDEVHLGIHLERYPHYFITNAVLPMGLVVCMSSFTYWFTIGSASGERLAFSSTLLLTIMATALFTAEKRPATNEDTWLDKYQAWCILLTFWPVLWTCAMHWLLQHFPVEGEIPSEDKKSVIPDTVEITAIPEEPPLGDATLCPAPPANPPDTVRNRSKDLESNRQPNIWEQKGTMSWSDRNLNIGAMSVDTSPGWMGVIFANHLARFERMTRPSNAAQKLCVTRKFTNPEFPSFGELPNPGLPTFRELPLAPTSIDSCGYILYNIVVFKVFADRYNEEVMERCWEHSSSSALLAPIIFVLIVMGVYTLSWTMWLCFRTTDVLRKAYVRHKAKKSGASSIARVADGVSPPGAEAP